MKTNQLICGPNQFIGVSGFKFRVIVIFYDERRFVCNAAAYHFNKSYYVAYDVHLYCT